jgi:hypothetical protein
MDALYKWRANKLLLLVAAAMYACNNSLFSDKQKIQKIQFAPFFRVVQQKKMMTSS